MTTETGRRTLLAVAAAAGAFAAVDFNWQRFKGERI